MPATLAREIGYPVLLKAAAGGGGKGMRRVNEESELESAIRDASSEAERAFQNGEVYIEKVIEKPRHIEIQIAGDHYGNLVHLGERECSLQRRHQKIVEECPSPWVARHPEMRAAMGEAALKIARAAGYDNLGTVEFLADNRGNFYFLEVNTRLQVEHPVTELVTGYDLVQLQLRIAAGEALPFSQKDVALARMGHGMPRLRRRSRQPVHSLARQDRATPRAERSRRTAGFGRLSGLDRAAGVRSAARETGRLGDRTGTRSSSGWSARWANMRSPAWKRTWPSFARFWMMRSFAPEIFPPSS